MKYASSFLIILLFLVSVGSAAEYRSGQTVYITQKDTLKSDLFAGAETVTISGTLLSDVYAGCKQLDIKGEVADDVIAGCKDLRISNKVGDQVIGFAETVVIDSEVGGDVLAYAGEVRITPNAHIHGNLHIGTSYLNFEGGKIDGKIFGGGGRAYLNGKVMKDVDLGMGSVQFGQDYKAQNGTKLKLHEPLSDDAEFVPDDLELSYFEMEYFFQGLFFYWSIVSMFIVGILLVTLFKNFSFDLLTYAKQNVWKNLGFGAIFFIGVPIAIILMAVLIVTIPVSLILLSFYLVVLYLSSLISGLILGDYLINMLKKNGDTKQLVWSLVLGILLVALIPHIPAVGWLFNLLLICFGMGSFILFVYQSSRSNKQVA